MKEFMFFIRKQTDSSLTLAPEKHKEFLKACEGYIDKLKSEKRLLSSQPIERTGHIISLSTGKWTHAPFNESTEVIGGYYHILASDLNEAIALAKDNPEFTFNPGTRIEVRPIKMKEEITGFVYPSG